MNLVFPSKTDAIMRANHLVHPDAVLRKLRILAVLGVIRERNGTWEKIVPPKDDSWDSPVNSLPKPVKNLIQCKVCGKDTYHERYCCVACKTKGMSKPLPKCQVCGNTCKRHIRTFCSKECRDKSQIGNRLMMSGGKRRMVNRRKS